MSEEPKQPWSVITMQIINRMTPQITGKAFDPDWFNLRQRFEEIDSRLATIDQLTKQRDDALDKLSAYEESIRFTIGTLRSLME